MLDSARHYQSPEYIKQFIDWMALHKLNVLHWHLTDDQAWRLEIKKYPRLTSVGAWRVPEGQAPRKDIDPATGKPRLYGGFYTHVKARMKQFGVKDAHDLQGYFIQRMGKFIDSKGRKLIGWDEILEGGVPANATVMSWRGIEGAITAAK